MKLLIELLDTLSPYGTYSYLAILGILLACGFGFPMPEDIILVTSGVLAARGIIDLKFTILLTMLGVIAGDGTIFLLGAKFGPWIKSTRFFRWILPEKREALVRSNVQKYGDKVIFMARFMPGLRTPVFFMTGSFHVPYWKFFVFDGFAALISVPLWVYVGFIFGSNLETLEKMIRRFQWGVYLALIGIVLGLLSLWFMKRRALRRVTPH